MKSSINLYLLLALAWIAGFSIGGHVEREVHDEWHKASDCPKGTWRFSYCVPAGCSMDLHTHQWTCEASP